MTREEANKELERAFDVLDHTCHMDNRRKEAFNMARVALSAEPCEDCISRKAVVEMLEGWWLGVPKEDLINEIENMPSIQPKPMQVDLEGDGYADGKIVYDYGKCPKCGWDFEYGDKDWEEPYCCHCGQKLKWFESEDKE